jgi:phage baseplate assembly protein W
MLVTVNNADITQSGNYNYGLHIINQSIRIILHTNVNNSIM